MEIKRPRTTYPSLEKFTRHVENAMKERVATLKRTGRYDNENIMDRVEMNWARVKGLTSRGPAFERQREQALAYIADRYALLQKQSNNPVCRIDSDTLYLEDSPELKARLGMDDEWEEDDDLCD